MHITPLDFSRPIPLFPLPNCVVFPGVVQPLHIFEPRYQQMMKATLADQSALAMALLKPGWEKNYYGCPAMHDLLCVGRIVTHEKLDDGSGGAKYNLLLHGVTRARVLSHHKPPGALYRAALLEAVPDSLPTSSASAQALQRKVLAELFEKTSLKHLTITASLQSLFDSPVPTPRLIDVLSFTLLHDIPTKQRLLEQIDPVIRGESLLRELIALAKHLDEQHPPHADALEAIETWPPPLSAN